MGETVSATRRVAIQLDWTGGDAAGDAASIEVVRAVFSRDEFASGLRGAAIQCSPDAIAAEESRSELRERLAGLAAEGLTPVALGLSLPRPTQPLDRGRAAIGQAIERVTALLELAAAGGVGLIVLSVDGGSDSSRLIRQSEESAVHFLEVLLAIRFEAEARSIRVAFDVSSAGFLGTAGAARGFVDEVNSYWVGACVSKGAASEDFSANPSDCRTLSQAASLSSSELPETSAVNFLEWMNSLGRRLYCVTIRTPLSFLGPTLSSLQPAEAPTEANAGMVVDSSRLPTDALLIVAAT